MQLNVLGQPGWGTVEAAAGWATVGYIAGNRERGRQALHSGSKQRLALAAVGLSHSAAAGAQVSARW